MRLSIRHDTIYGYATPAGRLVQMVRLTPRGHTGQFVINWRIDVDRDCRLTRSLDAFGNLVHSFTLDGAVEALTIAATGSVETHDTSGVVTGQVERFPPEVFLRETQLTTADAAVRQLATEVSAASSADQLGLMHRLMEGIRERMTFDAEATGVGTNASEAMALRHGVCQDFAHVFIAASRHLGIPARYVSGYMLHADGRREHEAGHAWTEALVGDLGWVGFDPTNGICPTEAYVRVAIGLDYLGAAPVRGTHYGGGGEALSVKVIVEPASSGRRSPATAAQRQSSS